MNASFEARNFDIQFSTPLLGGLAFLSPECNKIEIAALFCITEGPPAILEMSSKLKDIV